MELNKVLVLIKSANIHFNFLIFVLQVGLAIQGSRIGENSSKNAFRARRPW